MKERRSSGRTDDLSLFDSERDERTQRTLRERRRAALHDDDLGLTERSARYVPAEVTDRTEVDLLRTSAPCPVVLVDAVLASEEPTTSKKGKQ